MVVEPSERLGVARSLAKGRIIVPRHDLGGIDRDIVAVEPAPGAREFVQEPGNQWLRFIPIFAQFSGISRDAPNTGRGRAQTSRIRPGVVA
jgi:hypothetical protein